MIMKKLKGFTLVLTGSLLLSACSAKTQTQAEAASLSPLSIQDTTQLMMESLKSLDLDTFNEYSDNYVSTERNWLGIPVRKEYQVFSELLQPFPKKGKRYQANYRLTEKLMENLTWEIKDVRTDNTTAKVDMEITNIDMAKATGYYEISLIESMLESEGMGIVQLIKDVSEITRNMDGLILAIEQLAAEDTHTARVTLSACRENGHWRFELNEDFINAFMGNINSQDYPDEIDRRLNELYRQYEEKALSAAEQYEKRLEGLLE